MTTPAFRRPRFGDIITALPGTVTAVFADNRTGRVVGTPSCSGNWLVLWGDETILMGFHPENVRILPAEEH